MVCCQESPTPSSGSNARCRGVWASKPTEPDRRSGIGRSPSKSYPSER